MNRLAHECPVCWLLATLESQAQGSDLAYALGCQISTRHALPYGRHVICCTTERMCRGLVLLLCLQVTALETRVLQLQADEEVATVTAGPEAQAAAAHKLQQVQAALAAVDRVSHVCLLIGCRTFKGKLVSGSAH